MKQNTQENSLFQFNPISMSFYMTPVLYYSFPVVNFVDSRLQSANQFSQLQNWQQINQIKSNISAQKGQQSQGISCSQEIVSQIMEINYTGLPKINNKPNRIKKTLKKHQSDQKLPDILRQAQQPMIQQHLSDFGKSNWTIEQEQKLKELVNLFGKRWKYISQHFPNRSGKQIRERYLNYLRPNLSLKKWTKEQDDQILELVEKFGRSWKVIEKKLKHRSQNQIKNRYYGHLQKSERKDKKNENIKSTCEIINQKLRNENEQAAKKHSRQEIEIQIIQK